MRVAVLIGVLVVLLASRGEATVYTWVDQAGALHLSSSAEDVPEAERSSLRSFTAKALPPEAAAATSPADDGGAPFERMPRVSDPNDRPTAYERGLDRGLEVGEQEARIAGELARTMLGSIVPPPPPPPPPRREPPPFVVSVIPSYYERVAVIAPYLLFYPGVPFGGLVSTFGVSRFVPHSHFSPGTFGPRRGLFFPHGHATQDNGFLFGDAFVLR